MSDQLFGATEIALFGLIIRLFERCEHTTAPGESGPHIQGGRCSCYGSCAMCRSSNHFRYLQKICSTKGRSSWDYRHSLKTTVKTFFENFVATAKNAGIRGQVKVQRFRCVRAR